ncbi:WRKY transcription factor [Striga asiatica]|uniref:WRKY transcription factor n=1 Tax=Striga asiatica TaxID=4170 RepID=A0A5A7Q7L4_STRAF|nr:WRKY transcription factor [Striga asiatica]
MDIDLMMNCRNTSSFTIYFLPWEEKTASGLQDVQELLRLFLSSAALLPDGGIMASDYGVVASAAMSKFERDISLLGRNWTGHAQFRRAQTASSRHQTTTTNIQGLR